MAGVRVWAGVWMSNPDPNPNQTRDLTPGVCHTRDNPYVGETKCHYMTIGTNSI
jgi:hypothetical protein